MTQDYCCSKSLTLELFSVMFSQRNLCDLIETATILAFLPFYLHCLSARFLTISPSHLAVGCKWAASNYGNQPVQSPSVDFSIRPPIRFLPFPRPPYVLHTRPCYMEIKGYTSHQSDLFKSMWHLLHYYAFLS